jgi:hypothetical protein
MVPIMLTGQADLTTAIDAVNRGQIFRFLSKPCQPDVLRSCLDAALEQFRLRSAERELLEQTLRGSIEVLAGILALSNPAAFGRATRIQGFVRHVIQRLDWTDGWQYETAALLSQIGYVAVPEDLLTKMLSGESLPADQLEMVDRHPEVARDLLSKIPRLQVVAEMVFHQNSPENPSMDPIIRQGGRMLAAALDFEQLLSVGATSKQALDALRKVDDKYDEEVLKALASAKKASGSDVVQSVTVRCLLIGMVIQEDVLSADDRLIVAHGHEVTRGSLQRLRNYDQLKQLKQSEFRVHMPWAEADGAGACSA